MSDLYNRIYDLCQQKGISIGKMCTELNIRRSNLTELKMERIKTLKPDNLTKIAVFFDVTVDYLLGNKEKTPTLTAKDERDNLIEAKLVELCRELNPEGQEKLVDYAEDLVAGGRYIKSDEAIMGKEA